MSVEGRESITYKYMRGETTYDVTPTKEATKETTIRTLFETFKGHVTGLIAQVWPFRGYYSCRKPKSIVFSLYISAIGQWRGLLSNRYRYSRSRPYCLEGGRPWAILYYITIAKKC